MILEKTAHPQTPIARTCGVFLPEGRSLPPLKSHFRCRTFGFPARDEPSWVTSQLSNGQPEGHVHRPVLAMLCAPDHEPGPKAGNYQAADGTRLYPKCAEGLWMLSLPSNHGLFQIENTTIPRRLFSEQELHLILSAALGLEFKTSENALEWLRVTLNMLDHVRESSPGLVSGSIGDRYGWWMTAFALAKVSQNKDANVKSVENTRAQFLLRPLPSAPFA